MYDAIDDGRTMSTEQRARGGLGAWQRRCAAVLARSEHSALWLHVQRGVDSLAVSLHRRQSLQFGLCAGQARAMHSLLQNRATWHLAHFLSWCCVPQPRQRAVAASRELA